MGYLLDHGGTFLTETMGDIQTDDFIVLFLFKIKSGMSDNNLSIDCISTAQIR